MNQMTLDPHTARNSGTRPAKPDAPSVTARPWHVAPSRTSSTKTRAVSSTADALSVPVSRLMVGRDAMSASWRDRLDLIRLELEDSLFNSDSLGCGGMTRKRTPIDVAPPRASKVDHTSPQGSAYRSSGPRGLGSRVPCPRLATSHASFARPRLTNRDEVRVGCGARRLTVGGARRSPSRPCVVGRASLRGKRPRADGDSGGCDGCSACPVP